MIRKLVLGAVAAVVIGFSAQTASAAPTVIGLGALAIAVPSYKPGGFGGTINAPAGSDSAAGQALLAQHFPQSSANPGPYAQRAKLG